MSSTQMLLTNLAKKYAKVAAPAATVTSGSLRAFGCRLGMLTSWWVNVVCTLLRSCIGCECVVGSTALACFGVSSDLSTSGALLLLMILWANDEILATSRCSNVKRPSFSSLLLCRLSSSLSVASFLILKSFSKHRLKKVKLKYFIRSYTVSIR